MYQGLLEDWMFAGGESGGGVWVQPFLRNIVASVLDHYKQVSQ